MFRTTVGDGILKRTIETPLAGSIMLLALLAACSRGESGGAPTAATPTLDALDVEQPAGWADELALATPEDLDPDPNVLEIELEARISELELVPGHPTPVWTYSGTVPGPLIQAKVGDRVIVRFKNSLPEATSIHWHGVRVPNGMDGVPGVTQPPVMPGEEFVYDFVVPDAGTFWYHPHINSAAQVGWGMYGAFVVEDPSDPKEFGDDLVLVLSDIGVDDFGDFLPADTGGEFGDLFGREGTILLVNGKQRPRLKVRAGKQQRWRVINAARARYFPIRYPGHELVRLGGDNGLAERSEVVEQIVVVPGERADLVFTPSSEPGTTGVLNWRAIDRGFGTTYMRPAVEILEIETVADAPVVPSHVPEKLRTIEPIDIENAVELDIDLTIDMVGNEVVMGINGVPYWDVVPTEASVGETHVWTLINNSAFAHPFHLHGYYFQVLDDSRIPEWKDTVDVPVDSTVRIAMTFDERPGMWMYHCHILDHAESGMMGQLHVAD
jgi:FtsP/CotA-like multicopper oxidase with cupredoxin domain